MCAHSCFCSRKVPLRFAELLLLTRNTRNSRNSRRTPGASTRNFSKKGSGRRPGIQTDPSRVPGANPELSRRGSRLNRLEFRVFRVFRVEHRRRRNGVRKIRGCIEVISRLHSVIIMAVADEDGGLQAVIHRLASIRNRRSDHALLVASAISRRRRRRAGPQRTPPLTLGQAPGVDRQRSSRGRRVEFPPANLYFARSLFDRWLRPPIGVSLIVAPAKSKSSPVT